jgi:hypothetical protein
MSSRIKLPFKLGDSKKTNESEINETSRKEDFSLSEVRRKFSFDYLIRLNIRLFVMVFHIDQQHLLMILYKRFLLLGQKMVLLKCKF